MPKPKKSSILMRLAPLVPDVDAIAALYGIDVAKAKVIHGMLRAVEDATKELLLAQSQIVQEQAEFIEQQAATAKAIERQMGKERDARTILGNIEVFLSSESATVGMRKFLYLTPFLSPRISRPVSIRLNSTISRMESMGSPNRSTA